ncbi:MAG: protein-disulfide reductase DsbD, partial [Gammaproteobacteria bacterium]|nr:protein-disulfide reductase DsbD [Gammaproteobacteria bacterium]
MLLRTKIIFLIYLLLIFIAIPSVAERKMPLPAERAFNFSVAVNNPHEIVASWHIASHYYLYREHLNFVFTPTVPSTIHFPQSTLKSDSEGTYKIYTDNLNIPISLNTHEKSLQMQVSYQGCSAQGFCYPPMMKKFVLNLQHLSGTPATTATVAHIKWKALLTDQNQIRSLFSTEHFGVILILFVGIGLLLAFTPCVLPMVPILTSIILGQNSVSTKKAFFLSMMYVLGMAIAYALAGFLAVLFGNSIQVWLQKPLFIFLGSGIFVLLALSMFNVYELRMPVALQNQFNHWQYKTKGGTYLGVFCMGILSTLLISPCVTAPLIGILLYIAQTGDFVLGVSSLFMVGIGMGVPILLIALSAKKFLPNNGPWMEAVKKIFGMMLLALAVWMSSRVMPAWQAFQQPMQASSFRVVHNVSDLNKQLAIAQTFHKPVLLDFYADWCESCVVMDKNVFNKTDVMQALNHFILLRADLSENTSDDEALLKNFNIIAPPTVLFFNRGGQEINS